MTGFQKRLWLGLAILALLSPIGLILPRLFGAGGAWGEWGTDILQSILGFLPSGLKKNADFWKAPVGGYRFGATGSAWVDGLMYIISGLLGIGLVAAFIFLLRRFLLRNEK